MMPNARARTLDARLFFIPKPPDCHALRVSSRTRTCPRARPRTDRLSSASRGRVVPSGAVPVPREGLRVSDACVVFNLVLTAELRWEPRSTPRAVLPRTDAKEVASDLEAELRRLVLRDRRSNDDDLVVRVVPGAVDRLVLHASTRKVRMSHPPRRAGWRPCCTGRSGTPPGRPLRNDRRSVRWRLSLRVDTAVDVVSMNGRHRVAVVARDRLVRTTIQRIPFGSGAAGSSCGDRERLDFVSWSDR